MYDAGYIYIALNFVPYNCKQIIQEQCDFLPRVQLAAECVTSHTANYLASSSLSFLPPLIGEYPYWPRGDYAIMNYCTIIRSAGFS